MKMKAIAYLRSHQPDLIAEWLHLCPPREWLMAPDTRSTGCLPPEMLASLFDALLITLGGADPAGQPVRAQRLQEAAENTACLSIDTRAWLLDAGRFLIGRQARQFFAGEGLLWINGLFQRRLQEARRALVDEILPQRMADALPARSA